MRTMKYIGVDGCPYGWFSVAFDDKGRCETRVCRTFDQLLANYNDAALILVDIPIGLPNNRSDRDCDKRVRSKVGNAIASSVFPTPTRQTVEKIGKLPEGCICATNLLYRFKKSGVPGINLQTFAIVPKIAEVDDALRARVGDKQPEVREVHPELCFWALNGRKALTEKKKSEEGLNERLAILQRNDIETRARQLFQDACSKFSRKDVAKDDILDALAAAVTAYKSGGQLKTLPEQPPADPQYQHLRMEMVYWTPC